MAGKTATINVTQFRADWDLHVPIAFLCVKYTITKDQVVRLRDHWQLPLRLDRRLRFKPKRPQPPTPRRNRCERIEPGSGSRHRGPRDLRSSDVDRPRMV